MMWCVVAALLTGACAVRVAFDTLINVDVPAVAADLDTAMPPPSPPT